MFMEKAQSSIPDIKIPDFLKSAETYQPNLPLAVDYCRLHQTTKKEGYRRLAIESVDRAENTFKAYNIFAPNVKKIGSIIKELASAKFDSDEKSVNRAVNSLTNLKPVETTIIDEWRTHCTGCVKPVAECKNYRDRLEELDKGVYKGMSDYVNKAFKLVSKIFSE
jgi:hypothetical protein